MDAMSSSAGGRRRSGHQVVPIRTLTAPWMSSKIRFEKSMEELSIDEMIVQKRIVEEMIDEDTIVETIQNGGLRRK